jgi:hypothetical protein
MKKLFILMLTIGLFTACNNTANGLKEKDDRKTEKPGRDDGDDRNDDGGNKGGGWSKKERNNFLSQCEEGLAANGYSSSQARQLCNCVLGKVEKKYSSLDEANEQGGETAGAMAMQECAGGGGGDNDNYNEDDN